MQIGFLISLIFAILVATFAIKNGESVTIDLIVTTKQVSQAMVILVSAALGAAIVAILGLVRQIKLTFKIREQNKKIKKLEGEIGEYKTKLGEDDLDFPQDGTQVEDGEYDDPVMEEELDLDTEIETEMEKTQNPLNSEDTNIADDNEDKGNKK